MKENENKSTTSSSGIDFFGLFFLVLFVLKIMGYITWSWWWVTAPLWGGFLIWLVVFVIALGLLFWATSR